MKRGSVLLLLLLLLAAVLAGCSGSATANGSFVTHTYGAEPSPAPSQQVYTARPTELAIGSQPFAGLTPQNVRSIRITISRDRPPAGLPDPCKMLDTEELLSPVVTWLHGVRIEGSEAHPNAKYTPAAGGSVLAVEVESSDGTTAKYDFNGSMLSAGYTYGISSPADFEALYESLPTPEWYAQDNGTLTSDSDPVKAQIYVRRDGKAGSAYGELITHHDGKEAVLYQWVCLSPWVFGKADGRVVFAGYSGGNAEDRKTARIYSISTDGDDLKELDVRGHVVGDPLWCDGMLYYVGASSDGDYPRPLNRANADFSRHIKVMDIPGPLVCISVNGGHVYCLSADRMSLLRMPETDVKSFAAPIEQIAYIMAYNQYTFTDADGKENKWSPN